MLGYMNLSQQAAPVSNTFYGDVPFCDDFSNPSTYGHGPMVQDYNVNKVINTSMNSGRGAYTVQGHPTVPSPSLMYEGDFTSQWDMPMRNGPNPLLDLSEDSHQQLSKKKDLTENFENYNSFPSMPPAPSNMNSYNEEHFRGGRGGGGGRAGGGGGRRGGGGGGRRMGGGGGGRNFRRGAMAAAGAGALAGGALAHRNRNRNRPHHGGWNPNNYGPCGYGGCWGGYGPWYGGWGGSGGDWGTTYINIDTIPDAAAYWSTMPSYYSDPYSISTVTPDVYIGNDYDYETPVAKAVERVVDKKIKEDNKKDLMTNIFIIIAIVILILILYKLVSKRR